MTKFDHDSFTTLSLGAELRAHPWRLKTLQAHPRHRVLWLTFGQGRLAVGGRMRGFGANVAIAIPAGTPHALFPSERAQGQILLMSPRAVPLFPGAPVMIQAEMLQDQAELTTLTGHFHSEAGSGEDHAIAAAAAWATLISVWFLRRSERGDRAAQARPGKSTQLAIRFAEMLEEVYSRPVTVADCATALGVTATHLSRVCQAAWGKPANELINDRKLAAARDRLIETDERIGDIARDLGFGSAAYFNRLFSARTAKTPGQFRLSERHGDRRDHARPQPPKDAISAARGPGVAAAGRGGGGMSGNLRG